MPSLKELRNRKKSVQATRKITAAMKMIAAAKLKKAQEQAQAARPYARLMAKMLDDVMNQGDQIKDPLPLLHGTGKTDVHLIVVVTSDRGLCAGFNTTIVKRARKLFAMEHAKGRRVKILCVGRKGYEQLRRDYESAILDTTKAVTTPRFKDAARLSARIVDLLQKQEFDICTIIYNKFISALSHEVTVHRLIPFTALETDQIQTSNIRQVTPGESSIYEYEPSKEQVLADLLPRNLSVQIYRAFLETAASEHGARMTAMDSATRNAEDMMKGLELRYNRTRQAQITRELIEIISGAEAL
jgi:F-type H+-transporting ATPase subunit gamma